MAIEGMWALTEDGEFVLDGRYAEMLREARVRATAAWTAAMLGFLEERTVYDAEFLKDELVRRCAEDGLSAMEIVDEFVLEALGGDL